MFRDNVAAVMVGVIASVLISNMMTASGQTEQVMATQPTEPPIDANPPESEARKAMIGSFWERAAALSTLFEARTHTSDGTVMPYRLFVPADHDATQSYPLVIFLHGIGGTGTDNEANYTRGNTFGTHVWVLPENQQRWPCFVLAPQSTVGWSPHPPIRDLPALEEEPESGLTPPLRLMLEILENTANEYNIDRSRVYLTGQSMGGFGTWYLLAKRPEVFAAAVPICGGGDPAAVEVFKHVPVWAFHGANDPTVPVARSREMIEALRAAGATPMYTEYPDVAHTSWMWAYTEPALPAWLFSHKRHADQQ